MAKLVVLYRHPVDPEAFSTYYSSTHVPLAKTIPGLRSLEVSAGPVVAPDGSSPYFLVATLTFDSMSAIQAAMSSPEGVATAGDLSNFAQAGAEIFFFDSIGA